VSSLSVKTLSAVALAAVVGLGTYVPPAAALNFGDMMNPSRWMGGNRNHDRYNDDYYDDGPYGRWGGPYGGGPWGGGPYGGYGGPWGAPGYGYPGYGYPGAAPGAPATAAPAAAAPSGSAAPAASSTGTKAEIDALKRRIEELESSRQPSRPAQAPAPAQEWPAAPAFRPMNQY